ncbi:putative short chain dehydrogenase/reductase [Aspergillus ellipticus CBS 707.79]|uniref:Putative short chain dehydrogenase/reductase n=1 Tax=Aspergillus ellipticus CBS 707.79 TaxID=1448320 RepID=A0A319D7A4_9EURO|nr:putative short chain dehydrogenase/reductase [Aspergillus ellipticus CBS 707.79]
MDLNYDPSHLAKRTILITGGASGFGAAFSTRWATAGAQIIIGDINPAGAEVVARMRTETGNPDIHFIHVDVTSWTSQVNFFREAVQLSNHGGIDAVIANAGISSGAEASAFENPSADYMNGPVPPAPSLKTVDINLTGTMYTVHLALWFLPRNPGSKSCDEAKNEEEMASPRDRHILLMGSVASLHPLVTQTPYTVTKHGILGLFRCLRVSAPMTAGVRVNIICPYYTDTPLMSGAARAILAGVPVGKPEDVVEAATYLVASKKCVGRSLVTGPRLRLDIPDNVYMYGDDALEKVRCVGGDDERAIWECRLHDVDTTDMFTKRIVSVVSAVTIAKGWIGWAKGMAGAVAYPLRGWWAAKA